FGDSAHERMALVLDASASMAAGKPGERPIDRARQALAQAARSHSDLRVSVVLAGEEPALLGDADLRPEQAAALLAGFEPRATGCRSTPALDLAHALDLDDASLWLVSDDAQLSHPRLWRVGTPEPNLAIVQASWASDEAPFVAVHRFGPGPDAVEL